MRILVITIAVLLLWVPALQAATVEQQRDWFMQARNALDLHQIKRFHTLKDKLGDYALTPYLDIWHASKMLKRGDDSLVAATLIAYADVPENINLRRNWLKYLAKKGRWADAHRLIEGSPALASKFPEIAMMALWHVSNDVDISPEKKAGFTATAMRAFSKRWKQGETTTSLSKPLYKAWLKEDHPSDIERWYRIDSFARKGRWQKTTALKKGLNKQQKTWLKYWRKAQKHPEKSLAVWPETLSSLDAVVPAALMIRDAVKRLSKRDSTKAWMSLQQLKSSQKQISPELFSELERYDA